MRKKNKNLSGLTLIEMLIAIAIFAIGMEGFTLLFSKTWKNNAYTLEMGQASLEVSQGLNKMADIIRKTKQSDNGAYPIQSADDFDLVLYSDYEKDNTTERLHFYKSNQDIVLGITKPTDTLPRTYPSGDQKTVIIARHIINDADTPVFYYYNQNYPQDEVNNPLPTPASGRIIDIRLLKIYLKININPNRGPENMETQTFINMRNISN